MADAVDRETLATLALCGDVMTGRGIDQILAAPGDPRLYEPYMTSAADYVALAEQVSGPIPRRVAPSYTWGDALVEIRKSPADAFIINLETAVTERGAPEPKGINYRMAPANVSCLTAARVDCCTLSNNHILDWGPAGLEDTFGTLDRVGIKTAGAGLTEAQARTPAVIYVASGGRVLVFAFASPTSGVPPTWAARKQMSGVNYLADLSAGGVASIAGDVRKFKKAGDIAVASIHWGPNWGYAIPDEHRRFARALIDEAGIDVIHGHSSHHPKAMEVYHGRPILYGCGDFINDYEGISGHEHYRDDLALLYFLTLHRRTGRLERLELAPFRIRKFRLNHLTEEDTTWLSKRLCREYARFSLDLEQRNDGRLAVARR